MLVGERFLERRGEPADLGLARLVEERLQPLADKILAGLPLPTEDHHHRWLLRGAGRHGGGRSGGAPGSSSGGRLLLLGHAGPIGDPI